MPFSVARSVVWCAGLVLVATGVTAVAQSGQAGPPPAAAQTALPAATTRPTPPPLTAVRSGFCAARLYAVEILGKTGAGNIAGAILIPEVKDYPKDKIEIVAPVRLKDHLGVRDGDALTLEFLN